MDKMPVKIKQKFRSIYNSYRKIHNLISEIDNYFESEGTSSDEIADDDDNLVRAYNGEPSDLQQVEDRINEIEKIFISRVNKKSSKIKEK